MGIGNFIKKALGGKRGRTDGEKPRGLSGDETELNSYLEEERRDKIKQLLHLYRKKKVNELFTAPQGRMLIRSAAIKKQSFKDGSLLNGRNDLFK